LPPSEVLSCSSRGPPPPSRRAARPGSRGRRDSGSASRAVSSCPSSERLGLDVMREAIRRQADLMVAQVDLWTLLDREPDQAMAIEAAKGQLTPDQRSKLTALLAGARRVGLARTTLRAPASLRAGHAAPDPRRQVVR